MIQMDLENVSLQTVKIVLASQASITATADWHLMNTKQFSNLEKKEKQKEDL